jgi:hypothetical protein
VCVCVREREREREREMYVLAGAPIRAWPIEHHVCQDIPYLEVVSISDLGDDGKAFLVVTSLRVIECSCQPWATRHTTTHMSAC